MTNTNTTPHKLWITEQPITKQHPQGGLHVCDVKNKGVEYILNTPEDMAAAGYVPADQVVSVNPLEWLENDNMIYSLADSDKGWVDGERPKVNQYMIVFSRQNCAGGSDDELKAIKSKILSTLTTQPADKIDVSILTMKMSGNREEYYVRISHNNKNYDVRCYGQDYHNRAKYEMAELRWLLLDEPKPNLGDPQYADKIPITTDAALTETISMADHVAALEEAREKIGKLVDSSPLSTEYISGYDAGLVKARHVIKSLITKRTDGE